MVRLGQELPSRAQDFLAAAVEASDALAEQLSSAFRVEVEDGNVSEVAGKLAGKMRREAFRAASNAKIERELDEKYGVLKDVILHPTTQVCLATESRTPRLWPLNVACDERHAGLVLCLVDWLVDSCCWTAG